LATYAVRMRLEEKVHSANNEVAGFIFAAVGVIYGVLLAFLVLVVWEANSAAQVTVETEANALANMFRVAVEIPSPYGPELEAAIAEYAQATIDDEWPLMAYGRSSPRVQTALERMWAVHFSIDAEESAVAHDNELYQALETVGNERRIRLLASRDNIPFVMWMVLLGGAFVTIGFTLFLRAPGTLPHLLMAAMFAGLVAFVIFLIIELDNPFAG
jgi:hypothetical protein